ncbi:MAG TPA: menaquinol-cytochrome C reductase [Verrucomicrobiales bacterium]|nr:menaquinol-cytochrome C reductase [Verrucomicrobiales bacterium]
MKSLLNWLDNRTGIRRLTREALFENIPGGARWRYVWGSTLTFAILVEFITGIMLWMFYSPSANSAWESVYHLQENVKGGDWLRGIHHWTAQFMIVLLVLHLVQVVVDGAYKAPREFNFWFGLALLGLTMGLGLTGYLLPWDQKGYWATEVATNIVGNTPLIGDYLKPLLIGGNEAGHHTLTRFFALHAGVLPALLIGLIVLHIYLFRKHGITPAAHKTAASTRHFWWVSCFTMGFAMTMVGINWRAFPEESRPMVGIVPGVITVLCLLRVLYLYVRKRGLEEEDDVRPRRGDAYFWPDQVLRDAIACAVVMGGVLFFVGQVGTELSAPADPSENYSAARPDWYFMALFALLKDFDLITGAFVIPGVVATVVFLMPFIGRKRVGHMFNLVFLVVVLGGFVHYTLAAFTHDWTSAGHQAAVAVAHREADRVRVLAKSPDGIPPEGAISLLRNDPLIQGPKLFAKNCASCHGYGGHDGMDQQRKNQQSASDLKGFAGREWSRKILNAESFAHPDFLGATKLIEGSKMLKFLKGDSFGALPSEEVHAIGVALSAEAQLKAQRAIDAADVDLIEEGRELLSIECTDCHVYHGEGEKGIDLTGYGNREWQISFIRNPSHKRFYGKRNERMSIFGPKYKEDGSLERPAQLSDQEIGFIVDWLRGEWYEPPQDEGTEGGSEGEELTEDDKPEEKLPPAG